MSDVIRKNNIAAEIFDNVMGYNTLIIGNEGCGKTVLISNTIREIVKNGGNVFIYDVNGSYLDLCKELNGQYIDLNIKNHVNPFSREAFVIDEYQQLHFYLEYLNLLLDITDIQLQETFRLIIQIVVKQRTGKDIFSIDQDRIEIQLPTFDLLHKDLQVYCQKEDLNNDVKFQLQIILNKFESKLNTDLYRCTTSELFVINNKTPLTVFNLKSFITKNQIHTTQDNLDQSLYLYSSFLSLSEQIYKITRNSKKIVVLDDLNYFEYFKDLSIFMNNSLFSNFFNNFIRKIRLCGGGIIYSAQRLDDLRAINSRILLEHTKHNNIILFNLDSVLCHDLDSLINCAISNESLGILDYYGKSMNAIFTKKYNGSTIESGYLLLSGGIYRDKYILEIQRTDLIGEE